MQVETQAGALQGTTDEAVIESRLPDSLKAEGFMDAFGRTFACPECGSKSTGKCPDCGYTHAQFREEGE